MGQAGLRVTMRTTCIYDEIFGYKKIPRANVECKASSLIKHISGISRLALTLIRVQRRCRINDEFEYEQKLMARKVELPAKRADKSSR